MTLTAENALHGHTSEETAYGVSDYPYGYKLRTQIRYWIETTKHGDRFVSQTLNPKTDRWNKPKKSTYVPIGCMFVNSDDHVKWTGVRHHVEPDRLAAFLAVMDGHLSDSQRDRLAEIVGMARALEGVTWSIHEGPQTAEDREKQARIGAVLNHRIARETGAARAEIGGDA